MDGGIWGVGVCGEEEDGDMGADGYICPCDALICTSCQESPPTLRFRIVGDDSSSGEEASGGRMSSITTERQRG